MRQLWKPVSINEPVVGSKGATVIQVVRRGHRVFQGLKLPLQKLSNDNENKFLIGGEGDSGSSICAGQELVEKSTE